METKNGPRLIPAMNRGLGEYFSKNVFERFEITETRLAKFIQNQSDNQPRIRIVALPTNAGLEKPGNYRIYSTFVFPVWKVCYGRKGDHRPVLYNGPKCPLCETNEESSAVRFVTACSAGHLDDVDWHYAIHGNYNCKPRFYFWKTNGSSLSDIIIECSDCSSKSNMKEIYKLNFYCTGRTPEKETPPAAGFPPYYTNPQRPRNCEKTMKISQRQSTSLRLSETMTLLTIPEYDNSISRILQRNDVSIALDTIMNAPTGIFKNMDAETFIKWISPSLKSRIPEDSLQIIINEINRGGVSDFCDLYHRLNAEDQSFMGLMYEEFESLLSGAGKPTENFSMSRPKKIIPDSDLIPNLLVHPVNKIRTITVQTGYRRIISTIDEEEPGKISSGVYLDGNMWYPGYEGFGEGLFITFDGEALPDLSPRAAYRVWKQSGDSDMKYETQWSEAAQKPEFVWLHTLSHAIIRALSAHTGYSAVSLRERVYISCDGKNGGILIYNTSPGEDGGMGGLVGSVEYFRDIINTAIDNLLICSNDPLCNDVNKSPESVNGAACYSCLLISETSCEHRNHWLDRHLIIGD
ncbi:MAG TPA: DUF1998 domain-containing protein [Candidatus Methanoperedens sp.]